MLTGELAVNTRWGPNKPENHRFLTWNYRILNSQKIARKKNPGRFIKVSSKSSEMKNIWKLHKPWINFTIFRLNGLLHFLKKNTGIEKLKTAEYRRLKKYTVKPLITKTSEEFIKCRLDNFSMSFILYYGQFQYLRK